MILIKLYFQATEHNNTTIMLLGHIILVVLHVMLGYILLVVLHVMKND